MDAWDSEKKAATKFPDPTYHIEVSRDNRYQGRHGTPLNEPYNFIFTLDEKPYKQIMVQDSGGQPFPDSGDMGQ